VLAFRRLGVPPSAGRDRGGFPGRTGLGSRSRGGNRSHCELERIGSPFRTAERFGVQDLIDPRESRALLCDWVKDAYRLLPELLGRPSFGTRP